MPGAGLQFLWLAAMSVESLLMSCGGNWNSVVPDQIAIGLPEVTGPAWIVDNGAHYGG